MKWTEEELEYLRNNILSSKKEEIINTLNRNWKNIIRKAHSLNIAGYNKIHNKKFFIDSIFFSIPNIKNSYWAGFIAADGSIRKCGRKLEISIKETDKDLLSAFKKDIKYEGEIKKRVFKNSSQVRLLINNVKICHDLKENFNITNNKTFTYFPPESLEKIHALSFIKGFIDGDGCVKHNKKGKITIDFNGNLQTIKWIKNTLSKVSSEYIGNVKISPFKSIFRWSLNGKNAVYFLNIFKRLDTFNLTRKWNQNEIIKKFNINDFSRGWIIGSFLPSLFITDAAEVAIKKYAAGDHEAAHYHKVSTEITAIISGEAKFNNTTYKAGDIITIEPNEIVEFLAITDVVTVVVKVPHTRNDKYEV